LNAGANANVQDYSGWSPLHVAASLGYCDIGKMLLKFSVDVIAQDGSTPLHIAIRHRQFNFAMILIDAGVPLNLSDSVHRTPLHWACVFATQEAEINRLINGSDSGAEDILQAIPLHLLCLNADIACKDLLKHPFVEAKDKTGHTPLMNAAMTGRTKLLKALLEEGVNTNAVNDNQQTALHLAVSNGQEDVVKQLLDEKVDINAVDCNKANSLHLIAARKEDDSCSIAKMLVENGINTMERNAEDLTPLNLAVQHGHMQLVEVLLEGKSGNDVDGEDNLDLYRVHRRNLELAKDHKHDSISKLLLAKTKIDIKRIVSRTDAEGNTALHLAVQEEHGDLAAQKEQRELVNFLLVDKADVNKANKKAFTSLHLAAQKADFSICSILLKHGADVNHKFPEDGGTVLHFAVLRLPTKFLELFLQNKAQIDIQNHERITALGMAAVCGYEDEIRLLLERKANVNLQNESGETVLEIACKSDECTAARLLIQGGAFVEPEKEYTGILLAAAEDQDDKELVKLIAEACGVQPKLYGIALHAAILRSYQIKTINRLLDAGGNPHWRDEYGWSAFDLAVSLRRNDFVSLLQKFSPPAASSLDATKSTTRQESQLRWRKRQIGETNDLDITDLEVACSGKFEKELLILAQRLNDAGNGYRQANVQGSSPFPLSHTLHSDDSVPAGYDDPPTASSPTDDKPEIYFEITVLAPASDG
jgi:ankyrin repeat protein